VQDVDLIAWPRDASGPTSASSSRDGPRHSSCPPTPRSCTCWSGYGTRRTASPGYHHKLRRQPYKGLGLDRIPGVGPARKKASSPTSAACAPSAPPPPRPSRACRGSPRSRPRPSTLLPRRGERDGWSRFGLTPAADRRRQIKPGKKAEVKVTYMTPATGRSPRSLRFQEHTRGHARCPVSGDAPPRHWTYCCGAGGEALAVFLNLLRHQPGEGSRGQETGAQVLATSAPCATSP